MTQKYPPLNTKFPHFLHGGDYNPDQWPPEVWDKDMWLMKLAHCNTMSVGIFSWTALEPEEGHFNFGWLDRIMDMLAENNAFAVLATPTGARPAWMSAKYPEVLRVRPDRGRNLHGARHNHCYTSPVYREKTRLIDTRLAERYQNHPALMMWHLSNEYGGECHCELCQAAFVEWLKRKYNDSLDTLNQAWWTAFWSHTYTDWSQLESPSEIGELSVHGLVLDWKRFVTDQTTDFMQHEINTLKAITPNLPVTTNFMGTYPGLNYWKMAPLLDAISWDNYPTWHKYEPEWMTASNIAFKHDLNRSLKGGQPFMLMESTPSVVNWQPVAKLKRPGMHRLSSLQAVAHGSDTVQYFQWRKSRGSSEKLHGAVVDHVGHENTRVFGDVAEVGQTLEKMDAVVGTTVRPQVAVIYDWENRWALDEAQGYIHTKNYEDTCISHYRAFWKRGIPVDVIDMDQPLDGYTLVVAPMLYLMRPGVGERLTAFVENGGTLVTTYISGIVDETDLCFLSGNPGPLRKVMGIWAEEIDALTPDDSNTLVPAPGNALGLLREYTLVDFCDLVHLEGATALAAYKSDFYAGRPALTVNAFGKGQAYYIAARSEQAFLDDFYHKLGDSIGVQPVIKSQLPEAVTVTKRSDGARDYVFVMNFASHAVTVPLDGRAYSDLLTGNAVGTDALALEAFGVKILSRAAE